MGAFQLSRSMHVIAVALIVTHAASGLPKSETCQDLRGFASGSATVRSSVWFAGGNYRNGFNSPPIANVPPFCRAIVTSSPASGSNITIEVWLPDESVWNGKLLASGNGGFGGSIRTDSLMAAVKRNYVAANTDMGTFPASLLPNTGYDAGIGHPEMVKDWGYRSTHEMTLVAKALIRKYYSRGQSRSYFIGCSTGGHQALSEAQRYPDDYDAIIAGAAGHNRTHLHASFLQRFQAAQSAAPLFSAEKAALVSRTVIEQCAGKHGGAPGDSFLSNPAACEFNPSTLLCRATAGETSCLTTAEVNALQTMYDGTRNPLTHELIYPGWAKGTEAVVVNAMQRRPEPTKTGSADGVFRWVFGPQ
jgi:feruloyl esterase